MRDEWLCRIRKEPDAVGTSVLHAIREKLIHQSLGGADDQIRAGRIPAPAVGKGNEYQVMLWIDIQRRLDTRCRAGDVERWPAVGVNTVDPARGPVRKLGNHPFAHAFMNLSREVRAIEDGVSKCKQVISSGVHVAATDQSTRNLPRLPGPEPYLDGKKTTRP